MKVAPGANRMPNRRDAERGEILCTTLGKEFFFFYCYERPWWDLAP